MHHPASRFYSDSDDDRPSSCDSITSSVSQCTQESHLPSSLRKLLNPVLPSSPPSHLRSPSTDNIPQAPLARIRLAKQENQDHNDLSRLRPWKQLPSPRPLNPHPPMPLPPIYLCIPAPHTPDRSLRSCSPISPQFNPYYLPAPRLYRERMIEEAGHVPDAAARSRTNTPSLASSGSLASADHREISASNKTKTTSPLYDPISVRSERPIVQKNVNHSREKERNRCLTCGSSFSTFANLTRHEKKCPVAPADIGF
ncbi:hypothetical protein PGT21_034527 [Puccinia graminis f. sp. tritici]|uniref:C2H2-type domain-containing protein n=2 Tax=Puccinia graminis f. sp. tritici TaxID=56615 RepID=A0A5B0M9G9_PUCGR|nr:hypothetical protein PGT21_034527 [Puccinia graminis f. sp. tritici]KAA1120291.1 hypothetical protein PGTUg99_008395 [Puccinia graminis f. sp. tritici]